MAHSTEHEGAAPDPSGHFLGRRRAAGIYGAIITAAILAALGDGLSAASVVIAVVVTLLVYWLAEEYAELLGEHVGAGAFPSVADVRSALSATWPMVSVSFVPLLALVLARLAGASAFAGANVGLAVAVVLLTVHAWNAARAARLRGRRLAVSTAVAAVLGLAMIALKDLVLLHLH